MLLDNRSTADRMIWLLIVGAITMVSLLTLCILIRIKDIKVYILIIAFLTVLVLRLVTIQYFRLEISEDLISVRYGHPLLKRYRSAILELPLYKISSCQLEKNLLFHYIAIGVYSKRKNIMFYYNLGILSKRSINKINKCLQNIQYSEDM